MCVLIVDGVVGGSVTDGSVADEVTEGEADVVVSSTVASEFVVFVVIIIPVVDRVEDSVVKSIEVSAISVVVDSEEVAFCIVNVVESTVVAVVKAGVGTVAEDETSVDDAFVDGLVDEVTSTELTVVESSVVVTVDTYFKIYQLIHMY